MLPGDLARLVTVSEPAVAPDGRRVAFTVTRIDAAANRYRSAIWVVPAAQADGPARPLTAGDESDGGARWSPDGTRLAFVRTYGGDDHRAELCVIPVDGPGEVVVVASGAHGLADVDWSPDGERLAWAARVGDPGADAADRDRDPRRIDTLHTRLDDVGWTVDRRSQVFIARANRTEPPRQVTSGPFDHEAPRWAPDGRTLAFTAGRHDDWDLDSLTDLWRLDVDDPGASPRRLTATDRTWLAPTWSPQGDRLAAVAVDEREGWRNAKPYVVDAATGAAHDVAPTLDRNFAPAPGTHRLVWLDAATLLASYEDRGRVRVARLPAAGDDPAEVDGEGWATAFDAAGGVVAVVRATPENPGELFVGGAQRTRVGEPFLRACPPVPVERFTVPSPAGDVEIDAWMVAPAGGLADGTPLLVSVHGGPATQYGDRWFDEWQLWASAGFAVVACNPHGSSGRDEAFGRAIRSPLAKLDPGTGWGGIDADDILAVLDAALERWPQLDADRVGIHGGSYGGFMASWLCARTGRFAAGCSERAVNNLLSEEWSSDLAGTFWRELGVSHLDHPDEYLRMSPSTYARDIECPMLLLHSEQDLRCNIEQADALFVPLRLLGKPVEYWRFPAESHELSRSGSPKHRIRRAEIIIDFFRRHLGSRIGGD